VLAVVPGAVAACGATERGKGALAHRITRSGAGERGGVQIASRR